MRALAACVALLAPLAGALPAQGDELLFPYVVRSKTVTTLVSVVNLEPPGTAVASEQLQHLYFYKAGDAADEATAPCNQIAFLPSTSPNDVQTFDVGDAFGKDRLGVLFNDPSVNHDYLGTDVHYSGLLGLSPPGEPDQASAFLVVDNNVSVQGQHSTGRLYGEAVVLDFKADAAWTYRAYNSLADEALQRAGELAAGTPAQSGTFSNQFETEGEVLNGGAPDGYVPVTLLPDDPYRVRFLVTPIAPSVDGDDNGGLSLAEVGDQRQGDLQTSVGLFIETDVIAGGVAFDRDENPVSGPLLQDVVCVGGVDVRGELISQGVLNQLKQAGSDGGGWSLLQTAASGANGTPEAVVLRLDAYRGKKQGLDGTKADPVKSTGKGKKFRGVKVKFLHDAVWLRNATDHHPTFEALMPVSVFDVPNPANVSTWGPAGVPNPHLPAP